MKMKAVKKALAIFTTLLMMASAFPLMTSAKESSTALENNVKNAEQDIPTPMIKISNMPDKTIYKIGEELDLTGCRADAMGREIGEEWSWHIEDSVEKSPFSVDASEFDNTKPGTYNIYVSVTHGKTATTSFQVTVESDEVPTTTPYSPGDFNGDGFVNAVDAADILKYAASVGVGDPLSITDEQRIAGDVYLGDYEPGEMLNAKDASMILKASCMNGIDPDAVIDGFEVINSLVKPTEEKYKFELKYLDFDRYRLKQWNYKVPVMVMCDLGSGKAESFEFGIKSDLPFEVVTDYDSIEDEPWYNELEANKYKFKVNPYHEQKDNTEWFAFASSSPKNWNNSCVALLIVDVPEDFNGYENNSISFVKSTETRNAFIGSVDDDGSATLVDPECINTELKGHSEASISISKLPDKVVYQIGEELDLTGGLASASGHDSFPECCWDSFDEPLTFYDVDSSEFDNTKAGTYKIYVSITGTGKKATTYFEVTVVDDSETNSRIPGDVNDDEQVNLKDVVLLSRFIAGGMGVTINESAADVNADGMINLKDVVLIRRYIVGGWDVVLK